MMNRWVDFPVPVLFFVFSVIVLASDPARPLGRSIPIALGRYSIPVAGVLLLAAWGLHAYLRRKAIERARDGRDE